MREENSTAKGFLILSIAGMVAKVMSVFYMPLLTKIIGTDGYGIYSNTYAVFVFFYAITSTGTQPAVAKIVTELEALDNKRDAINSFKYSRNVLGMMGAICSLLLIVFAYPLSRIMNAEGAVYGIMAIAPCVFLTSVLSAYRGYFQGKGDMKAIAISQVIEQFLNIVISLSFAYLLYQSSKELPLGVAGGTIGTGVGALIAILTMIYYYDKNKYEEQALATPENKKHVSNKKILSKLIKYGLPITLSAAIQNFGALIDVGNVNNRLMNAALFTAAEKDFMQGVLGNYIQFLGVPIIIITALATTVLPSLTRAMATKNRKDIKGNISYALKMSFLITIPSAIGLSMLREEIYTALFLPAENSYLMLYGSGVLILMGLTQIQGVILQGINRQNVVLRTFMIGIVLKIACNYVLVGIREINILGVIVGNYILYLIPSILNNGAIMKSLRMKISLIRYIVKPTLAGGAMAVSIYVLQSLFTMMARFIGASWIIGIIELILIVLIAVFVYGYIMIVLQGIMKKDIDAFSPKIYGYLPRFVRKQMK